MPLPRVADDDLEIGISRPPPQFMLRAVTGCIEYRRISRAARRRLPGHRPPDDTADGVDHGLDRVWRAGADVVGVRRGAALERFEGADMRLGEVADVDVVPQAGAVRRRVVLAEYLQ